MYDKEKYQANKTRIKARLKEKYTCSVCGSVLTKNSTNNHITTIKHLKHVIGPLANK